MLAWRVGWWVIALLRLSLPAPCEATRLEGIKLCLVEEELLVAAAVGVVLAVHRSAGAGAGGDPAACHHAQEDAREGAEPGAGRSARRAGRTRGPESGLLLVLLRGCPVLAGMELGERYLPGDRASACQPQVGQGGQGLTVTSSMTGPQALLGVVVAKDSVVEVPVATKVTCRLM